MSLMRATQHAPTTDVINAPIYWVIRLEAKGYVYDRY